MEQDNQHNKFCLGDIWLVLGMLLYILAGVAGTFVLSAEYDRLHELDKQTQLKKVP